MVASTVHAQIISPAAGQDAYDTAINVSGTIRVEDGAAAPSSVRAFLGDVCCGETRILSSRGDGAFGFRLLGTTSPVSAPTDATLRIVGSYEPEVALETLTEIPVRLVPAALRSRPYGEVVFPENETLLHRENIYGSGPPLEQPGLEVAALIASYLPEGASVVDIGCGAGAYGPGLIETGHEWLGLEANAYCCEILERRKLPFRRVNSETAQLPGADSEFDCAICIEVLEHVANSAEFVAEIARLARKRALFSVPNLELLPYTHDWGVVPWHLLEADHKNFFTRASLRAVLMKSFRSVEVFSYGEHSLRTRDGIPLHVHLFAIADK